MLILFYKPILIFKIGFFYFLLFGEKLKILGPGFFN